MCTEAATSGVPVKKVFLEISQNSQENPFYQRLFFNNQKKSIWHRCFPVNFTKFLRTSFLHNTFGQLLLFLYNNIWSENLLFYHKTCFPRKTWVLFILYAISKIAYYLNRHWKHWNWRHCSQKTCLFNFHWKVCKIKVKKGKSNVIINYYYYWMCLNMPKYT